jgi:YD repeat-containing protein
MSNAAGAFNQPEVLSYELMGVTEREERRRATNVIDGAGSRFFVYDANGRLLIETNSNGALIGANLRFTNDVHGRRTSLSFYATNTALLDYSYAFDAGSRMTNISDGTYQASYSYLANSPLVSQIIYRSNSTTRMTTSKTYDFLNRLTAISSQPSAAGASPIGFHYAYNDANQRTRVNMDDGSFWLYEYDSLGQLVSGKRFWSDWIPVAGQPDHVTGEPNGFRSSINALRLAVGPPTTKAPRDYRRQGPHS